VVGLVEYEGLDGVEPDRPLSHQVEQASGARHDHVGAAPQRGDLGAHGDAPEDERRRESGEPGEQADLGVDLGRQLARGSQHEAVRAAPACIEQPIEQG
jgi:hypothetical protein